MTGKRTFGSADSCRCCTQVQTNPVAHANKAVNHVEGGWPKEVDFSDAELTIRYRKKVRAVLLSPAAWTAALLLQSRFYPA